ncbi:MAG: hypothetical protein QOH16_3511 [Gaiellaceae bacterium]|nr:hypothetical protein [Gaiellaceae bacterium]
MDAGLAVREDARLDRSLVLGEKPVSLKLEGPFRGPSKNPRSAGPFNPALWPGL